MLILKSSHRGIDQPLIPYRNVFTVAYVALLSFEMVTAMLSLKSNRHGIGKTFLTLIWSHWGRSEIPCLNVATVR